MKNSGCIQKELKLLIKYKNPRIYSSVKSRTTKDHRKFNLDKLNISVLELFPQRSFAHHPINTI